MSKKEKKSKKVQRAEEKKPEAAAEAVVSVEEPKEETPKLRHLCQCCKIRGKHGFCKVLEKHVPRKGGKDCGAFVAKK